MSQLLREFLSAYLEWVDAGAVHGEPFDSHEGLCLNVWNFPGLGLGEHSRVVRALDAEFERDGLDANHPFGGHAKYMEEYRSGTHHLNPARIQWVRSKVAQYEVV